MFNYLAYLEQHTRKFELVFLTFLLFFSAFLRIYQLGYSDFYGDETKVFYLRKDVGAQDFLLNQRKGPMQFLIAWGSEKVFGTYDEFYTRLPFALAGLASVFLLYFLVREFYGRKVAAIAATLFSLNGFFIAFSRTVQYQSFLLFFGLLSVYLFVLYMKSGFTFADRSLDKHLLLFGSGVSLAFAYLSHWDAVFYDVVLVILLVKYVADLDRDRRFYVIRDIIVFLGIPFLTVLALYFFPYFKEGYFTEQVTGYISRRVNGSNQLINNSSFTFWLYNPEFVFYAPFLFVPFAFSKYKTGMKFETILLFMWFLIPFFVFQFFISNPGTHTQNYFVPLLVLSALGFVRFHDLLKGRFTRNILKSIALLSAFMMFLVATFSFVPSVNTGYPWQTSTRGPMVIPRLEKDSNQYFIYGFPYNGGWRQVRDYFVEKGMPRSFYTNDNVTIGEYYLYGVPAHRMHPEQMPEYYIYVYKNQEYTEIHPEILIQYQLEHEILYPEGFTLIYKLSN